MLPSRGDVAAAAGRRVVEEAGDAVAPFAGALGRAGEEVVASDAGVGVEHENRGGLAQQRVQHPDEQRVLHAVGGVAGVEGVAIVHVAPDNSLNGLGAHLAG